MEYIINKSFNGYPNSSDKEGNIFLSTTNDNEQATRIAIRSIADEMRIPDAKRSYSVTLLTLSNVLLMFLTGTDINSKHVQRLINISKIQLNMNFMVNRNTYDSLGFYENFKLGKLPAFHFNNPKINHLSLYQDKMLNPFQMDQPIWFGTMMALLGDETFNAQLKYYESTIRLLNIVPEGHIITRDLFLKYIYDEYSKYVEGSFVCGTIKYRKMKNSIFTLEPFDNIDDIYEISSHGSGRDKCDTKTWFSSDEINFLLRESCGCPTCHYPIDRSHFVKLNFDEPEKELKKFYNTISQPIYIKYIHKEVIPIEQSIPIEQPVIRTHKKDFLLVVQMNGTVGSGKTSAREILYRQIKDENPTVNIKIFSPDDINKCSLRDCKSSQNGVKIVAQELDKFNKEPGFRIAIIDTCGDIQDFFGIRLNNYRVKYFRPNFNPIDQEGYLSFSLYNVLKRESYSSDTNYYLNHIDAGLKTCIKVHFSKAKGLFTRQHISHIVDINASLEDILKQIEPKAMKYASTLLPIESQVSKFINDHLRQF